MSMDANINTRQPLRLESLPGEVLNAIYRYSIVDEYFVNARVRMSDYKWKTNEPALARVCKRFRKEVLPIYYSENVFRFQAGGVEKRRPSILDPEPAVVAWVNSIGEYASHVQYFGGVGCGCIPELQRFSDRFVKVKIPRDADQLEFSFLDGGCCPDLEVFENANRFYTDFMTSTPSNDPVVTALCCCWDMLRCRLA